MAIYYFLPTMATLLCGIGIILFLSKALGAKMNALWVERALTVVLGSYIIQEGVLWLFGEFNFSILLIWAGQFLLIKKVFNGGIVDTLLFTFLGIVFPFTISKVLAEPISYAFGSVLF